MHAAVGSAGCTVHRANLQSDRCKASMLILSGAPQLCVQMHHAKQRRQRIHPVNSSQRRGCGQRCGAEMGKNSTSTSVPGPTNEERRLVIPVGDKEVVLETGEIGRQANGAVMATLGETVVYSTACAGDVAGDGSFLPLAVHYAERFSAAGKTASGFIKRDGRPKESETLVSRLVDRSLRPAFAPGWGFDTQVLQWVLSYDGDNQTEGLAITAASAALAMSDIPLRRVVAGVRVGLLPGEGFVVNPTSTQMASSTLDLLIAGTSSAVLMIEGFCDMLPEDQLLEAIRVGHQAVAQQCAAIQGWAAAHGKEKRTDFEAPSRDLDSHLQALVGDDLKAAYLSSSTKQERAAAVGPLWERARTLLVGCPSPTASSPVDGSEPEVLDALTVNQAMKRVEAGVMRRLVTQDNFRADGRATTEVRPISSRAGLLPRTHGCALFTRGETQAIAVATLGSEKSAQRLDSATDDEERRHFYLQYFFPPSSVGETGRVGGAGRREVGHGNLAERALAPVVPDPSKFPYTVRVESTITESNGSSSMASVCGGCLAMLDAGVPLKDSVAGVAMGLILEADGQFVILTDILGSEDALGDMDFKVAGTADGVTAFQMDIKVEGITLAIMEQALAQAREGRRSILASMDACSPPPRREFGRYTMRIGRMQVPIPKIGLIIGPGGRHIHEMTEKTGCDSINIDQDGSVTIVAPTLESLTATEAHIATTIADITPGVTYRGVKVVGIQAFGCFVECLPGQQGLVHVSELDVERTDDPAAKWKLGDAMDVMCLASAGKVKLSRKEVLLRDAMKPGSWKWPGGFSETPKDLTPDELTRGMVKISASANGSGKPAGAGRNGGSGKAAGAGRDGGSGTETPSTRLEWKPKKPDLQVSGARANKEDPPAPGTPPASER